MKNEKLNQILNCTERGISLSALVTRVLLRWPVFLVGALVFGCIGIGRTYTKAADKPEDVLQDAELKTTDYAYLSNRIDEELVVKRDYLKHSILMNLNNKAVPTAVQIIYVKDNGTINTDLEVTSENSTPKGEIINTDLKAITELLNAYVQYGVDYQDTAEAFETEARYIRELVSVTGNNGVIRVSVVYKDTEGAEKILDQTVEALKAYIPEVIENFDGIELVFLNREVSVIADNTKNTQINDQAVQVNNLLSNKNTLANYKSIFALAAEQGTPGAAAYLKAGMKYGVVGFALELIIVVLKLIFANSVLSADELNEHYQLNKLIAVPQKTFRGKEIKGFSKKIIRMDPDSRIDISEKELTDLLEEEINGRCTARDKIAVVSDLSDEEVQAFIGRFGESNGQITALNHLETSAEEREEFAKCNKAILLAKVEKSKYSRLNEILKLVVSRNIDMMGTVTL